MTKQNIKIQPCNHIFNGIIDGLVKQQAVGIFFLHGVRPITVIEKNAWKEMAKSALDFIHSN